MTISASGLFALSAEANQGALTLAGLVVNGKEVDTIDAWQAGEAYFLPLAIAFAQLGVEAQEGEEAWRFELPIGEATLAKSAVQRFDGEDYLPLEALKPLGITALYNQQLLAIELYVPWDSSQPFPEADSAKPSAKAAPEIDFFPERFGLNNVQVSGDWSLQQQSARQTSTTQQHGVNVGMSGHALGGNWAAALRYRQASRHSGQRVDIRNLYWTRAAEKTAWRIGTNSGGVYGGLGGEYTGVSVGYSNRGIATHLASIGSHSSGLLGGYSRDLRNIKGTGPVGGIAELRVNGNAIARVRIALDERYEFIGLNMGQVDNNEHEVEVAIYEYSLAEPPIRIDKPLLAKRQANVATGEWLLSAGAGVAGNAFDRQNNHDKRIFSHAYSEYGLSNNIALRAAVANTSSKGEQAAQTQALVGFNWGISTRINWDMLYRYGNDAREYDSNLNYSGKRFDASYNYQHRQQRNRFVFSDNVYRSQQRHYATINLRPHDRFTLNLNATHRKRDNEETEKYFTASAYARLHDNLSANVSKDRHNDYSYGINWSIPRYRSQLNYSEDKRTRGLYFSTTLSPSLQTGGSVRHNKTDSERYYHAFVDYQPWDKHKLHFGYDHHRQTKGYDFNWRYQHNNYASFYLGYRKNQSYFNLKDDSANPLRQEQDYFYLQFNLDFYNHPNRGLSFGQQRNSRYGTILTDIQADNSDDITFDDRIQLQLDGHSVDAHRVGANQYQIENVKPGVYQLSFPDANLPLEYQQGNLPQPIIKVANTAHTVVPLQLQKTLGISGKVADERPEVVIYVYQNEQLIKQTTSNLFGYYQIIGLPAGVYSVKAKGYQTRNVTIDNDFVFEADLAPSYRN